MTRYLVTAVVAFAAFVIPDAAAAIPCLSKDQAMARSDSPRYREVDGRRCWYTGKRTPKKSEFVPVKVRSSSGGQKPKLGAGEAPGPSTLAAGHAARASASPRGEPAPEQARLAHTFDALAAAWNWRAQIQTEAMFGILRLEYPREFPAAWAMASRWP